MQGAPSVLHSRPLARRRRRPDPGEGEHTEYVCKQILNLSDEEIALLLIDEVLR